MLSFTSQHVLWKNDKKYGYAKCARHKHGYAKCEWSHQGRDGSLSQWEIGHYSWAHYHTSGTRILIVKNEGRLLRLVRDSSQLHHFYNGSSSCGDH